MLDQLAVLDTIDHGMLPDCLSSWLGVGLIVLDWFKSYLPDHSQHIKISSVLSNAKDLLFWGATGLFPRSNTLFLIYYSPQQSHLKIIPA